MADNLGLLFNAKIGELLLWMDFIVLSAERVPVEGQENAALVLPDMDHFVKEEARS